VLQALRGLSIAYSDLNYIRRYHKLLGLLLLLLLLLMGIGVEPQLFAQLVTKYSLNHTLGGRSNPIVPSAARGH